MSSSTAAASAASAAAKLDAIYGYDEKAIVAQRKERPWEKNVKYFHKCRIAALAACKILKHALAGVEKGRKAGTNPVEIMGLLVGKTDGDSIIVLDAVPLPVEGSETRVVADDAQIHMLELMESMELRRKEAFIGWYHSHPFDLETYSHCHMSAVDVQTQTSWQHASPTWTAIVVDPLRSLMKQEPEFGCFRVYPATHTPAPDECPDGSIAADHAQRMVRWGAAHHRYYALTISYFMSSTTTALMENMSTNSLWVRALSSSAHLQADARQRSIERMQRSVGKLSTSLVRNVGANLAWPSLHKASDVGGGGDGEDDDPVAAVAATSGGAGSGVGASGAAGGKAPAKGLVGKNMHVRQHRHEALGETAAALNELAIEQCKGHSCQTVKQALFNLIQRQEQRLQQQQQQDVSPDAVLEAPTMTSLEIAVTRVADAKK